MKLRWKTLIGDTLILALCILALVAISRQTAGGGSGYVQVQSSEATYRYSLDVDREITVQGPLGETHIVIEDGHAHIEDSACPTKSCTFQKPISNARSWIACLPNQVLLTIVGSESENLEVDDVAN
ncbi:MAG: NusG domain II-containing protein [Sphaerochaetaceae bacterium]|nr:NusG domain II-containing protein [uncultured Sphaerochaeta sp.]MDC7230099.1 NusG domain II-containing protein [Sphaerochaetaceae bacterium]